MVPRVRAPNANGHFGMLNFWICILAIGWKMIGVLTNGEGATFQDRSFDGRPRALLKGDGHGVPRSHGPLPRAPGEPAEAQLALPDAPSAGQFAAVGCAVPVQTGEKV